ncbi:MAG: hypothetical protein FWG58_00435 [Methanomassiliicoccaceae archaeon]|nr:hypothetical protein [Methanomassiliicoccaceae archaeon]
MDERYREFGNKDISDTDASDIRDRIDVVGTPEQAIKIYGVIERTFTNEEQKALVEKGNMKIIVREIEKNIAAIYLGKSDGGSYKIIVDPRCIESELFLHELIHHSRMVDDDRQDILIRSRSESDSVIMMHKDDRSLEEAATVLETLARHSPYKDPKVPSYHNRVAASKEEAFVKIKEDRELVTGTAEEGSEGLKGKEAKDAVTKNFKDSHISDLVIKELSPKTAKDRLNELESKDEQN